MNTDNTELNLLTERVIGAALEVGNTLGAGFWRRFMNGL